MPTCAAGHDTASTDFCDVCGMRLGAPAAAPTPAASPPGAPCPRCGAARSGQFCETCGYDFASGAAPRRTGTAPAPPSAPVPSPGPPTAPGPDPVPGADPGAAWMATVTADRAYFDSVVAAGGPDAGSLEFPAYCPERRFRLSGAEMRIGRRSASRGLDPEIDLTGPPADPGVSHLHAVLIADPDGGWAVLDPGSSNGTQVNGKELVPGTRTRLNDGDRIALGAWTVFTISASGAA